MAKNPTKALSDFIKRIKREKNLSLKAIERASEDSTGEKISGNYVNDLINGNAVPTVGKVQALARGLGESEDLLFEIARGVEAHSTGAHRCSSTCLAKQISELSLDDQNRLRPLLEMVQKEVASLRGARQRRR